MNDFRVLLETTFNYKGGKLYLMLLRDSGRFAVEVVNKSKTFGRKFAKDRNEADDIFGLTSEKLSKYTSLLDAESSIKRCFSVKSMTKLKFLLTVDDNVITLSDIVSLRKKIDFRTRVKINYKRNAKEDNALTVYVYESRRHKKPWGLFVGTREAKDLKFELL